MSIGEASAGLGNASGTGGRPSAAGSAAATIAGAPGAPGGSNTGGGPAQAGQAGQTESSDGGAPGFEDGCADLDNNGNSDCTETLLQNSAFGGDVSYWTAESDANLAWDAVDLRGHRASGSALVSSSKTFDAPGNSLVAANQCVAVQPETVIAVFADAKLEDNSVVGKASLSLWFFAAPDCPGDSALEIYQTPEIYETGMTVTMSGVKAVPEGARSMRVRLGVSKPFRAETFSVRFDNVLVAAR